MTEIGTVAFDVANRWNAETPARRLLDFLIAQDPATAEILKRKIEIRARRQRNQDRLATDNIEELEDYPIEEVFPLRELPVCVAKTGVLYTTAVAETPHLAGLPSLPNIRYIDIGELYAAASWGILPKFHKTKTSNKKALIHTARAVDDIRAQVALNSVYDRQHYQVDQLWPHVKKWIIERDTPVEDAQVLLNSPHYHSTPPTTAELRKYLLEPSTLSERVVLTILSRLGTHLQPEFRAYQPRTGLDVFGSVDILLHVFDQEDSDWLIGLDVTTQRRQDIITAKARKARGHRHSQTTDPFSGQRLPFIQTVLPIDISIRWHDLYESWEQKRGRTVLTPEFFLDREDRIGLIRTATRQLATLAGDELYPPSCVQKAYQSIYGFYEN